MEMLNIKINGKDYQVEKNTTILEACHQFGINFATLRKSTKSAPAVCVSAR